MADEAGSKRGWVVPAALVCVAVVTLGYYFAGRNADTDAEHLEPAHFGPNEILRPQVQRTISDGGVLARGNPPGAPGTSPGGGPGGQPTETVTSIEERAALRARMQAHIAQADREYARFPPESRVIEADGEDSVASAFREYPRPGLGTFGTEPAFHFRLSTTTLQAGETLLVYGELREREQLVAAQDMAAEISPSGNGTVSVVVELRDDGREGDEVASDLIYTGALTPASADYETFRGAHNVVATAHLAEGDSRSNRSSFVFSVPGAGLTGNFRDANVEGDLYIYAEVEVEESARYHVEGVIYGGDEPIGWGQRAMQLEPGTHEIPLRFYGLMFHDRGIDGPYVLRSVRLRMPGRMPGDIGPLLTDGHTTGPYQVSEFSSTAWAETDEGSNAPSF